MGSLGAIVLAAIYLSPPHVLTNCLIGRNPLMYGAAAASFALYMLLAQTPTTKAMIEIPLVAAVFGLTVACLRHSAPDLWGRLREGVYLTAKATAMVCWLFVGSWTFASVFSYLGGHDLISVWVKSMDLEPWQFLLLAQAIIFLLGWPLEWSEIVIIFVPIFLPLLDHFNVNPYFFAMLIALNLQTSFLTPPMAMSAYYLKGVLRGEVELMQIFRGIMPYLGIVIFTMFLLYQFPAIALWLPDYLFGPYIR
jgi:TRAP-type mannitol/chloroaromatic compound transport system permease large subunit